MKLSPLDKLFSEYIRRRAIKRVGGCEKCKHPKFDIQKDNGDIFPAWKRLQCAHFDGRKNQSVRFDEMNAAGLCGACHLYIDSHPFEKVEWIKTQLGEREFDFLQGRMRNKGKSDENLLTLYYREKIRELTID